MKNYYFLSLATLLFTGLCFSVNCYGQIRPQCGNTYFTQFLKVQHPEDLRAINEAFELSKKAIQLRGPSSILRIPVVFHIVYKNTNQNIPDSCITRQIEILNESYGARNADRTNLRSIFGMNAEDAQIEFYLASKDPAGNPSNGIIRKATTKTFSTNLLTGAINIDMKSNSKGGSDPWNVKKYLNIWVVNMPIVLLGTEQVGIIGYASPPANLPNWPTNALNGVGADGIVMQYQFIGDNNPQLASLGQQFQIANRGRALVHETGHYLGLRHIWADKGNPLLGTPSCLNTSGQREDDGIDDTPYCGNNSQTAGCDSGKNTCTDTNNDMPDMWENYMDYSEESCQVVFTPEQIKFMRSVIEQFRKDLTTELSHTKTISSNNYSIIPTRDAQILISGSDVAEIKEIEIYNSAGQKINHSFTRETNSIIIKLENHYTGLAILRILNNKDESRIYKTLITN